MKQRFFILILFVALLGVENSIAQMPKWMEKAKRAVLSVVTYDDEGKILNTGNAFFVTEDGIALSDYELFKGAHSAVVVNTSGEKMPVESIIGANDMYDVIKFRVTIPSKKVPFLMIATSIPEEGTSVYLLPYATQKVNSRTLGKVSAVDKIEGGYSYYTLELGLKDKMVSCPLMTSSGEVFGLAQKSSGKDTINICYAVDAKFAMNQSISPFAYSDRTLKGIGIKKALPTKEEEALVFLYMASTQLSAEQYMTVLNDFVYQYPNSADGYMRRVSHQLALSNDESSMIQIEKDMDKALNVAKNKDDVYYNRAKTIYTYSLTPPKNVYKDWGFDKALSELSCAKAINTLPMYQLLEGDIYYAKQDYASALSAYEEVNKTDYASPLTFYSAASAKKKLQAPKEDILALLDSCVACFKENYTSESAPYLLERANLRMELSQPRAAIRDYDFYYQAVNGEVNDLFYYYREQAALKGKQYQRALDDIAKAIELNPTDLTYRAELAVINIRIGRNEEALKVLKDALVLDANYAEAYRLMGIAQIQLKRKDEACISFLKAKELGDTLVNVLIEQHCK